MPCFALMPSVIKSVALPFSVPSVYECVPTQTIRNHSVFDALHCAEASPSAIHVMVDNAVCRLTDIFDDLFR
jgi:hypothetical protein